MKVHKKNNTKQNIIEAAYELVKESGFRSLTVRSITNKANVNTGSFVYYFQSKEAFADELIETWYAPYFSNILQLSTEYKNSFDFLQAMCLQTVKFAFENRNLICQLLLDVLANEVSVSKFTSTLYSRHPQLFIDAISKAQKENLICQKDPEYLMFYIFSTTVTPFILQSLLQHNGKIPEVAKKIIESEDFADYETRLNWALKSIRI